ncbi:hypothetical protein PFDG_05013 [Plasmodium falciparum Dd2]|uniref:Uncharacterized protein n=1 Tax=Plasmodium falciparum (isolate Dd2) TaxID=57267 RepID=A0A0L7M9B9_PLAF4|nr:hypothetical protein PFDG_05013 [Plasmodium falciparum Dd2]
MRSELEGTVRHSYHIYNKRTLTSNSLIDSIISLSNELNKSTVEKRILNPDYEYDNNVLHYVNRILNDSKFNYDITPSNGNKNDIEKLKLKIKKHNNIPILYCRNLFKYMIEQNNNTNNNNRDNSSSSIGIQINPRFMMYFMRAMYSDNYCSDRTKVERNSRRGLFHQSVRSFIPINSVKSQGNDSIDEDERNNHTRHLKSGLKNKTIGLCHSKEGGSLTKKR